MRRKNREPLGLRVTRAAEWLLADRDHVSPIDVMMHIGWLDPNARKSWEIGRVEALEAVAQVNPARLQEALELLLSWAKAKGLKPIEGSYVARTPQRQAPKFSLSGDPALELAYRLHFLSPTLSEKAREKLVEKTRKPAELVVIVPLKPDWKCHRCEGTGNLLIMENEGPCCMRCAGLDDLEFLAAGDALLTRRVKARSARSAVVVRFARNRGRYERQGLLVEKKALAAAQREVEKERRGS